MTNFDMFGLMAGCCLLAVMMLFSRGARIVAFGIILVLACGQAAVQHWYWQRTRPDPEADRSPQGRRLIAKSGHPRQVGWPTIRVAATQEPLSGNSCCPMAEQRTLVISERSVWKPSATSGIDVSLARSATHPVARGRRLNTSPALWRCVIYPAGSCRLALLRLSA